MGKDLVSYYHSFTMQYLLSDLNIIVDAGWSQ
jgi:hypothetical protein